MDILKVQELEIAYDSSVTIMKGANLSISKGQITVLLGASGSGKSTLLRCLAGLHPIKAGEVWVNGKSVALYSSKERVKELAYVAQDYQLFAHMTVEENCVQPQRIVLGKSEADAVNCSKQLMRQLGVADLAKHYPQQLSGGQKQRVAIARALGMGSKILLLDEPSSALDPESTRTLAQLLRELSQKGMTIVLSTHDMDFADAVKDRILRLSNGVIQE